VTPGRTTALVADDEPLLRDALAAQLAEAWPGLDIVARARNGREAVQLFEAHRPDVCVLDVHMPGLSGIDAARRIAGRAHLVFVTAYDHYAVQAFAEGVLDYLVKPVTPERLAVMVERVKQRLEAARPVPDIEALLQQLAARLQGEFATAAPLRWLRAQVGHAVRLIAVEDIEYLRSDAKYTRIAWRGDGDRPGEAVVGTPLRELAARLDATRFAQVHRAVVVNLGAVSHVVRGPNGTASLHLKRRSETLPVSRSCLHLFGAM
jgi:DNA-binding LytR/AlgR family response regulator